MNQQEDPFETPAEVREWCERMTRTGPVQSFRSDQNLFGDSVDTKKLLIF